MSQVVEPPRGRSEPAPNRIRWTRAQCDAMREAGILTGRYELIDGEILIKMGQNPPHSAALTLLMAWLAGVFGARHVRIQSTIDVSAVDPTYAEPEPDAAVTAEPATAYPDRHPGPSDLLLIAEVADTTLRFDLTTKARLYARAGIKEYWVLDLTGRSLYVHRSPGAEGYGEIVRYDAGEMVAPLARPDAAVRVMDLLPPVS